MRGETVDFDLFDIKNKILSAPVDENTKQRERFIDKRKRRSSSRKIDEMLAQQKHNEESVRAAIKKSKDDAPLESSDKAEAKTATKRQIRKTNQVEQKQEPTNESTAFE